jgi:hypothetical protein
MTSKNKEIKYFRPPEKKKKDQYQIKKIVSQFNDQLIEWIDFSTVDKEKDISNISPIKSTSLGKKYYSATSIHS